jgi:pheromone shutdown protein TraB
VVHDHPASVHRVREIVSAEAPDVVALELPPLAVPLFEEYASDGTTPPAFGGEMSAAIQAAETDDVVGIDGPSRGFVSALTRLLYRDRASVSTVVETAKGLLSVTRAAALRGLAAAVVARTSLQLFVGTTTTYDVGPIDSPERQASDERACVSKAEAMLNAFEPTPPARISTTAREHHMAERLTDLRENGDVVAVVGMGHLEGVTDRLQ